jgi:hypothetical protein
VSLLTALVGADFLLQHLTKMFNKNIMHLNFIYLFFQCKNSFHWPFTDFWRLAGDGTFRSPNCSKTKPSNAGR